MPYRAVHELVLAIRFCCRGYNPHAPSDIRVVSMLSACEISGSNKNLTLSLFGVVPLSEGKSCRISPSVTRVWSLGMSYVHVLEVS